MNKTNKSKKTNNSKRKNNAKKTMKYQSNRKNTKQKIISQLGGTKTDVCEEMAELKRFGTLDIFNYALQIPKLSNPSGFANTTLVNKNIQ
jgi:nicotinamidase-related amidase